MIRRIPIATRTDTLVPYTTLFLSVSWTGTCNDDADALQALVDAAATVGIRNLYLPPTRDGYNIVSTVTMNSSMGGTTLSSDAAGSFTGGPVLRLGFDGVMLLGQSTQIRLKNIRFEGNRALYTNGTAVRFAKTANTDDMDAMVDDCEFEGDRKSTRLNSSH